MAVTDSNADPDTTPDAAADAGASASTEAEGSGAVGHTGRKSFSVANINPGTVRSEFMLSVMALINHERELQHTVDPAIDRVQFDQFYAHFAGPYLDDERNRCIEWFLANTTSDYLLFIDSDIGFTPDDAFTLIDLSYTHNHLLTSGVYCNAWASFPGDGSVGPAVGPVAYRWAQGDDAMYLAKLPLKEVAADPGPFMRVDATGSGFMAIHRDLIDIIGSRYGQGDASCTPWFAEVSWNGVHMGEDMTFCQRAILEGHHPHLATRILVDHYKTSRIRPMIEPATASDLATLSEAE